MDKKVTLNDVAIACGISPSTVSRVLNNSVLVGEEKRDFILETANRLGYNKRTIRKQESRAILNIKLFLPETRIAYINLFYDIAEMIEGMYQGFGDVKVNIIVRINHGKDEIFVNKKLGDIDGCVFAFTTPDEKLAEQIDRRKIPMLLVNRERDGRNSITYDNEAGMTTLLEKIIAKRGKSRGERIRPCYIGFEPVAYVNRQRREGLSRGCNRFGIEFDPIADSFEFQSVKDIPHDFISALKSKNYNAIMCFNDVVALSIYQLAISNGYSFPKDFSLTGYDDSPILELLSQRIDTIRFNVSRLGLEAGQWLRNRIIERETQIFQVNLNGDYVEGTTI